mgnify:CR=1 FL=1
MKKFILYVIGAIFLFASCQSDQLETDDMSFQVNDAVLMKALDSFNNYKSPTESLKASKSVNANQVTREFKMLYSRWTVGVVPNSNPYNDGPNSGCEGFYDLQFVVDVGGIGSLIGKFSVRNLACVDMDGNFVSPLYGWITAANGDVLYTMLDYVIPDMDNPNFVTYHYNIIGGSPGGRFENASGFIEIYGDGTANPFDFVGGGEITY